MAMSNGWYTNGWSIDFVNVGRSRVSFADLRPGRAAAIAPDRSQGHKANDKGFAGSATRF